MADGTVRSVTRALTVMKTLDKVQAASLAQLQVECGLPKPTLLRLLKTLESEQLVWRAAGDGLWRPAFHLKPTRILSPAHQRLVHAAFPFLEELRRVVVWPSDLAVRDGTSMLLLETTRKTSGLAINRDEIGLRIDLLRSAVGRAFLSALAQADRDRLAASLARHHRVGLDVMAQRLEDIAIEVNRVGYATREAGFVGPDGLIDNFDDQLAAIAVPVALNQRVLGAINVVWLKRFDTKAAIVKRCLRELHQTAQRISQRYADDASLP